MISKEEKIKLIRDIAEKNDIKPYEIGQKTSISSSSAQKIFSGEQKNPRNKTLNIILEYLENTIVGTKGQLEVMKEYTTEFRNKHVAETPINYHKDFSNLKIDDKLNIIYQQNLEQNNKLELISNALGNLILDFEEAEILKTKKQA